MFTLSIIRNVIPIFDFRREINQMRQMITGLLLLLLLLLSLLLSLLLLLLLLSLLLLLLLRQCGSIAAAVRQWQR